MPRAIMRQVQYLRANGLATRHARPEFGRAAAAIEAAIDGALKNSDTRTADLGGKLGTQAFAIRVAGLI